MEEETWKVEGKGEGGEEIYREISEKLTEMLKYIKKKRERATKEGKKDAN